MILASLTDPLVQIAVDIVGALGLGGVFILMTFESALIPIPSEAIMLFAGFNVARGHYSLAAVTIVGALANLVGSWLAYALGYYGRLDLLEKHQAKLHISGHHLDWAERWFNRYGTPTVFFARMVPLVRTFISLPAGVAKMPFWRFSILTLAGCVPWVLMLALVGEAVGSQWQQWRGYFGYIDYVVVAVVVAAIVYAIVRRRRSRRQAQSRDDTSQGGGPATETV